MRAAGARLGLLAALLALASLAARAQRTTTHAPDVDGPGGWRRGRATFFGGNERFLANFPDRGPPPEYGFGNIRYGSCGFYQQARACPPLRPPPPAGVRLWQHPLWQLRLFPAGARPSAVLPPPPRQRLRDSTCRPGFPGFRRGSGPSAAVAAAPACQTRCWPCGYGLHQQACARRLRPGQLAQSRMWSGGP